MFPSWVVVLKLFKKVYFLQFRADLSKKSKSIKAVYICIWKVSLRTFRKWFFFLYYGTFLGVLGFEAEEFC